MSLILKIDGDSVWLAPQSHSYSGTVILLHGHDGHEVHGQPVDVPADLLLAVSPLLRSILSAGHLPPAYHQPAISLPSVTYQVLHIVKELFVSGMVSIDTSTKVTEIQSVFKMLGIGGVELICDQPRLPHGVKVEENDLRRDNEVEDWVYSNPVCGSVKNEFINQIKCEKNQEYFENDNFEDAFSRVKNHQTANSLDIVKVQPDSDVELSDPSKRPSISTTSIPLRAPKMSTPGSKIQKKFQCYICKKKFRRANELSTHASEQHNIQKPFHCFSCRVSAKSYKEILEHKRLAHIDQFKCDLSGISHFVSYAQFMSHNAWHKRVKTSRMKGLCWGCGKCTERFASIEDLAAHKDNRKHHDISQKGS